MQKFKTILLVTFLALALIPTTIPLIPTASAATEYTEINGTLSGGNYTLRIPSPIDAWNRVLIIYCRGYSSAKPASPMGGSGATSWSSVAISAGSAFAATDYGAGGFCIKKAMNATYELTQYLVSTYKVAKVFLWGISMGGDVALLLGEKYPRVYSGVLDMFGAKVPPGFPGFTGQSPADMNDTELTKYLQGLTAPIPPYPFSVQNISDGLQLYRNFISQALADMVVETGGTPTQVLDAYRAIFPVYHANISIPVITVHGTSDALVPYADTLQYQAAVSAAGKSAWYRLYSVVGGQHGDALTNGEVLKRAPELMAWSDQIRPLLQATAFSNVTMMTGWTWWFFTQAVGNAGALKYQWFEGATLLQGQTSSVCPVTKNAPGKYEYYCQITDADGVTINTNTISLTVVS